MKSQASTYKELVEKKFKMINSEQNENDIQRIWMKLKEMWLHTAKTVCGKIIADKREKNKHDCKTRR